MVISRSVGCLGVANASAAGPQASNRSYPRYNSCDRPAPALPSRLATPSQASVVVMALGPGDKAPDFELPDETGTPRRLSQMLTSGPVVLFFYPAAMTPGCTAESCHFRDLESEFKEVGAQPVGISADPVEKQKRFSDRYSFGYPLLSDSGRDVAASYGTKRNFSLAPTKRTTFVIASDGTVLDVVRSEVRMSVHADRALATLRSRAQGPGLSSHPDS